MMISALPWTAAISNCHLVYSSAPGARLLVAQIIFFAKHEHHDVGVLLDRTGFAQVGKLRTLVVTVFDLPRQLGQRQDGHVELLGECLEAGRDLGHFLHAAFHGAPGRALQKLNVIDDEEIEPLLPLQTTRAGGELRDGEPSGLVDEQGQMLQLDCDILDLLEFPLVDPAPPDRARRDAALLGDDAGRELLGRHFEREKSHDAAIHGVDVPVGAHLAAPGAGNVVADVGGERGLAHARPAGDDHQVGGLQPAQLAVEVPEPGGQSGEPALALIGARGHVDGGGEGGFEPLEPAAIASGLRQLVEATLGVLDLVARREIDRRVEGDIDHVLADPDQLAPDREVVDRAAVVQRVDDGGRFGGEAGEILRGCQPGDVDIGRQERLQRHRRCELAGPDKGARDLEDLLMDRLEEVRRLEKVADPIERLVVDEDRPQERLLRLDVMRRRTVRRCGVLVGLARSRFDCHDVPVL